MGLFQVFQLGLLEISCHVVDVLPCAGGQCLQLYADKPIYDIPGTPATTGRALVASLLAQAAPFRPHFHLGQQVETLVREPDGRLRLGTSAGTRFLARTVIIAAGVGAFQPKRIALAGIERFEGSQLLDHPAALEGLQGRHVVVNGGDDTALEAAISLAGHGGAACPASVTLLYRRDAFQAEDATVARMRALCEAQSLRLVIGQIAGIVEDADGRLTQLLVETPKATAVTLPVDTVLAYLGISPRLGPIADWGLALERKQVPVDTERFQTCEPGVFAVGDINTYPGKKKLILCGFHEATLAAWGVAGIVFPERRPLLQYTTTSTRLHELLGVSPSAPR
ncbi:MAG: NAD(P)/FAD-dependent oxidoreductase [Variovorax sp.]